MIADNVVYPGAPGYLEYVDTAAKRYETRLIDAMFEYDQVWKKDWKGTPKDASAFGATVTVVENSA